MIDKVTFARINPNSYIQDIKKFKSTLVSDCGPGEERKTDDGDTVQDVIPDEELLLATPLVYGFSLSDKMWRKSLLPSSRLLAYPESQWYSTST
jgi:hypothetical protein